MTKLNRGNVSTPANYKLTIERDNIKLPDFITKQSKVKLSIPNNARAKIIGVFEIEGVQIPDGCYSVQNNNGYELSKIECQNNILNQLQSLANSSESESLKLQFDFEKEIFFLL